LQRLSTRKVYVVTRSTSGRQLDPDPLGDRSALERQLADLVGGVESPRLTRLRPNVFRLDRVGARLDVVPVNGLDDVEPRLVENLVAALEVVEDGRSVS
jgi:hypothetical protein